MITDSNEIAELEELLSNQTISNSPETKGIISDFLDYLFGTDGTVSALEIYYKRTMLTAYNFKMDIELKNIVGKKAWLDTSCSMKYKKQGFWYGTGKKYFGDVYPKGTAKETFYLYPNTEIDGLILTVTATQDGEVFFKNYSLPIPKY